MRDYLKLEYRTPIHRNRALEPLKSITHVLVRGRGNKYKLTIRLACIDRSDQTTRILGRMRIQFVVGVLRQNTNMGWAMIGPRLL
jgi:hypothetical protein